MSKSNFLNRLFAVLMVCAMLTSLLVPAAFAEENEITSNVTWEKVENQGLASHANGVKKNDEKKADHAADEVVRVSIIFDEDSTIAAGYSTEDIAANKKAMTYRDKLEKKQSRLVNTISNKVLDGAELDVVWNLTLAANLVSANVEYGKIEEIEAIRGVKKVIVENKYEPCATEEADEPQMGVATNMTGAVTAWAAGYTGAGSRIAIIDTGVDDDHELFTAAGLEYAFKQNAEKAGVSYEEYVKGLELLDAAEIASVWDKLNAKNFASIVDPSKAYISTKIAYAVNYIDRNLTINHDNDSQGEHGSHVTGIAAANRFVAVDGGFANSLEAVATQGVAPDAQILTMKVFGAGGGAYDSDYMAAIEDAIILGADAVNLSLGSAAPGMSFSADYEDIMDAITESGTVVCMSAGNNSHWGEQTYLGSLYHEDASFMTGGSPGSFTNSFTTASVDNDGAIGGYFKVNDEDTIYVYTETNGYGNKAMTSIAGEYEYVMLVEDGAGGVGSAGVEETLIASLGADVCKGKVVFTWRGGSSFYVKANAAVAAGAVATIVGNNQPGAISMNLTGYNYSAPAVSITQADARYIKSKSTAVKDENDNVLYYTGKISVSAGLGTVVYNSDYYTMSSFSSFGMPGNLELTPEITTPGGSIYSVNGLVAGGKSYELMSGTSMASPHNAGLVGLVAQYIRENDLEEKTGLTARQLTLSLLMSTAKPMIDGDSEEFYPVFQQGSGLADVAAAVSSGSYILMKEDATESYADGKVKVELGDDPDRKGEYTFGFSINNMTDEAKSFEFDADMFTQDFYDYYGYDLLDTWTAPLAFTAKWVVDGNEIDPAAADGLRNCDFDGDGDIDIDDGQALLDWFVNNRDMIYNEEYADFDDDGDIDTYDAYLFFKGFSTGAAVVPANDSVDVTVTITLQDIDDFDLKGAYVEGYIYANEMTSSEGAEGDAHSIPVLGYYGAWSEPDMFDKGTYWGLENGEDELIPYLYAENDIEGNLLTVKYADGSEYIFGGNPVVEDDYWMPERDAFNGICGDKISKLYFTLIRNAADMRLSVTGDNDETYLDQDLGMCYSAYYYPSGSAWRNTNFSVGATFPSASIPEGTRVTVALSAATEYDVKEDGSVAWDELADGATKAYSFIIDNTAPEVSGINYKKSVIVSADPSVDDEIEETLSFTASDNQYIAGVIVYDNVGNLLGYLGSDPEAVPGEVSDFVVALNNKNNATKFLVEVYDYASNCTSYKINLNKEELTDGISVVVNPKELTVVAGGSEKLTAEVGPWGLSDSTVTWSSSDEKVATVNQYGVVTGVDKGECVITATSNADKTVSDSCKVTVKTLDYTILGELQDVNGAAQTFMWDLSKGGQWESVAKTGSNILAATASSKLPVFYNEVSAGNKIEVTDFLTGEITATYDIPLAQYGFEVSDMELSGLTSASGNDMLLGVSDGYLWSHVDVTEGFAGMGWGLAAYLKAYTGASAFVALANDGANDDNDGKGPYDFILALDDACCIWMFKCYSSGNLNFGVYDTNLDIDFPGYEGSLYCSMVEATDGNLFLSAFDGDTNNLYLLEFVYDEEYEDYIFAATSCGNVGADVWPCALIGAAYTGAGVADPESIYNAKFDAVVTLKAEQIELTAPEAFGGLNSAEEPIELPDPVVNEPEEVSSSVVISEDEKTVTVTLVAHDSEGKNVDVTNGMAYVEYDAELLELDNVEMFTQYSSVNAAEDGKIALDFVEVAGLKAGEKVAVITFKVKDTDDTEIKVTWDDINEEDLEVIMPDPETTEPVEPGEEEVIGEPYDEDLDVIYDHDYDDDGRCIHCGKERPRTGDEQKLSVWTLVFLLSAAGLVFIKKRTALD